MVGPLPVGYYLDNFNLLLDFVAARYSHLLNTEETAWRDSFGRLSRDAARLYVRLCSRKGPLFREDKLNYPEIEDLGSAIDELSAAGFVDFAEGEQTEALLALLNRDELIARLPAPASRSTRRDQLQAALSLVLAPGDAASLMPCRILRPLGLAILDTYRVLFFGNPYQGLTEFVLNDLGITPFEAYEIDTGGGAFPSRAVMEEAKTIYALGTLSHDVVPVADAAELKAMAALLPASDHANNARRAARIQNRVARQLERLGEYDAALELYGRIPAFAPARERSARILAGQGEMQAALALCEAICADPLDEAEYEFGAGFGGRLAKKLGLDSFVSPPAQAVPATTMVIPQAQGLRVEEQARQALVDQGDAYYVENALFPGLFGLVFWDIIFHPVKGAFFNPFQRGPDDLFTPGFRARRRDLLNARIAEVRDPTQLHRRALGTWQAKWPTANHFVQWGRLSPELLELALARIPPEHISAVFERLLRDLRNNRSGFPDLIVFPAADGYRLVEIKGPGDTLQKNQRRWLKFFGEVGVPAEVVSVEWQ